MLKLEASQEPDVTSRSEVDTSSPPHSISYGRVAMTPSNNIQSHEKPAFNRIAFWRKSLEVSWSSNRTMPSRATINTPDWLNDHLYHDVRFGHSRSRSCDSYIPAPDNISLRFGPPVRSSKATLEIRGRSYSTVSASKSRFSGMVLDEYQICMPESRKSSRIPFTEQNDTNTLAFGSTCSIVHSQSKNGIQDSLRSSASSGSSHDIDGKDCRISGYNMSPQGDCARKPNANLNGISKTWSISDEAESETKDNGRSGEAMHSFGSPCKSDLDSKHEESDSTRIDNLAEEVSYSGLQKFDEIFDRCDAEKRFNSDPKRCLLNTKKGQRCGGLIQWKYEDMIREVLASLANLYFEDDEHKCIRQLGRLAELAICKRNHRAAARRLIGSLLHDHGASIVESVMDGTDRFHAGASGCGSSAVEMTDKSSGTSFKKQDVIPDDIRKEIQDYAKGRQDAGRKKYVARTTRSTTLKKRILYWPKFLPYKPREATKSSTTEWLKKQISKPLLPTELASGWLYVYWNRASFGFVKIGYTTKDVDQRVKRWGAQCKHDAALQSCSDRVPHVRRLEQIVHAEFKDFRYCERNCPGCYGNHTEWFQLPRDLLRNKAIMRWVEWMLTEPYEEIQGVWQLKPHHAETLDELGNMLQVRERQEVNKQVKTSIVVKQEEIRTSRGEDGKLRVNSKVRQINRALN